MNRIESEYQKRIDEMSVPEKVARSAAMFQWTRERIGRRIRAELAELSGEMVSDERLKWLVAMELYGDEPVVRGFIEEMLANVPD